MLGGLLGTIGAGAERPAVTQTHEDASGLLSLLEHKFGSVLGALSAISEGTMSLQTSSFNTGAMQLFDDVVSSHSGSHGSCRVIPLTK